MVVTNISIIVYFKFLDWSDTIFIMNLWSIILNFMFENILIKYHIFCKNCTEQIQNPQKSCLFWILFWLICWSIFKTEHFTSNSTKNYFNSSDSPSFPLFLYHFSFFQKHSPWFKRTVQSAYQALIQFFFKKKKLGTIEDTWTSISQIPHADWAILGVDIHTSSSCQGSPKMPFLWATWKKRLTLSEYRTLKNMFLDYSFLAFTP